MSDDPKLTSKSSMLRMLSLSRNDLLILAATIILCIVAGWFFLSRSAAIMGDVEMGIHGWIALFIGVVVSMAVGIGLMVLVFFSARRGFDESVKTEDEE
jgi:hypothetical protein